MDEKGHIATESVARDDEAVEERWPAQPWPRLWARLFDTWLFASLLAFLLGLIRVDLASGPGGNILFGIMILPFALLVDAASVALFGSTPGKWLAGLRIERGQGGPIGRQAFRRNADLYVTGYLLGLPILNLFGFARARAAVVNDGRTGWDERTDSWVIIRGNRPWRTALTALLAVSMQLGLLIADHYMQRHQPTWDREIITAAVPDMNAHLPRFIDDVTRLDRISFPVEQTLIYEYQLIHRDATPVAPDELNTPTEMRASLLRSYCAPSMLFFRERDIPVRHRIFQGDALRLDVQLNAADCGG